MHNGKVNVRNKPPYITEPRLFRQRLYCTMSCSLPAWVRLQPPVRGCSCTMEMTGVVRASSQPLFWVGQCGV